MSVINELASQKNRRDEEPNKELAKKLVKEKDIKGIKEIADRRTDELFEKRHEIIKAIDKGSVITIDNGIKTLSKVAAKNEEYNKVLFPFLIKHLQKCRPKDIPQHAESIYVAINSKNKKDYIKVLNMRKEVLKPSQLKRVEKILKMIEDLE